MRTIKVGIVWALGFLLAVGCSPKPPTPAINSAATSIDFPGCRATNLNFSNLDPENFRSMVTCLNGRTGAVQPFKDLFDSIDTKDLSTLLEVFNRHFFSNPERRNQSLDLIGKLHARGDLNFLMNGLSVAAETQIIENVAPLTLKIMSQNDSDLGGLKKYFIDLIDKKILGQALISIADYFGGLNGRSLGLILAAESLTTTGSMTSDQVVDLLVTEIKRSLDDGSFLNMLSALKDPTLQPSSLIHPLDPQERNDLAQYLSYTSLDREHILQCQNLAKASDHGVRCFEKGPQYLKTDSLFLSIGREVLKRSSKEEIDKFFLQTLPLDLSATESNCSFLPGVGEAINADKEIISLGYGNGKHALFKALLSTKATKPELTAIKSDYFLQFGPLYTELGRRGAYPFILNVLGQDVSPTDSLTLSQGIEESEVLGVQENFVKILRTLLSQNLHPLGRSLVKSMGEARGGLGDIFGAIASGVGLSNTSNPFQDAFRELLQDEDLMNRLQPIFISILEDSRLPNIINFTGQLAANGQLEKIIVFLAEILQTKGLTGLSGPPLANSFQRPSISPGVNIQQVQRAMPILTPTQKFLECKKIDGSVFAGGGNFYNGLQCLGSENKYPSLLKVAEDLKTLNLLDEASFISKNMIEISPYFVSALNQLNLLNQSQKLDVFLKLYSWAVENPYAIPARLGDILQDGFTRGEMPMVLKSIGHVLKMPSFSEASQAVIDVVTQPPKKVFQSQTDFRLRLKNEDTVRAQIAKWYPNYSKTQLESVFQTAKENFETHNRVWLTHEGTYPDLSETQWRQEIFSFFQAILRTTDIEEIVLALQQIAKDGRLYEMLSQTIENQRVVLHYFRDGSTVPHIMTYWDQLEELVQDANFVYSPVGAPPLSFHVAVSFQQAVVRSTHYAEDMDVVKFLGRRGVNFTSMGPDKPNPLYVSEWTHFKNMTQNYGVLDFISNNGQLKIFQLLYSGLLRATPASYRNKNDAHLNHMAGLFHLNNVGFFEQTTMAMASMQSQGRLQYFISNLLGVVELLGPSDIEPLREVILNLVSRAKNGDIAPLDLILNKMETVQNNKEGYQNIKDALFHFVPAINQLGVQPSGVLKGIVSLLARSRAFKDSLESVFSDAEISDGHYLTMSSNVSRLDSNGLEALRKFAAVIFLNDPTDGSNALESVSALLSDLYSKDPEKFLQLRQSIGAYLADPRVKALNLSQFLRNTFGDLKNQQGFGSLIGNFLSDPQNRQRVISLGSGLARSGDFAPLSQFFDDLFKSGDFESIIHFIFDNFSSSSVKSM